VTPSDLNPGTPFEVRGAEYPVVIQVFLVSTRPQDCRVFALHTDFDGNPAGATDMTEGLPTESGSQPMFGPPGSQRSRFTVPEDAESGTYLICEGTDQCARVRVN
jgi:hypothetical protein